MKNPLDTNLTEEQQGRVDVLEETWKQLTGSDLTPITRSVMEAYTGVLPGVVTVLTAWTDRHLEELRRAGATADYETKAGVMLYLSVYLVERLFVTTGLTRSEVTWFLEDYQMLLDSLQAMLTTPEDKLRELAGSYDHHQQTGAAAKHVLKIARGITASEEDYQLLKRAMFDTPTDNLKSDAN